MFDKLPAFKSQKERRKWFWKWFLTNAVFNLIDVENMPHDMESEFKRSVLIGGRCVFFQSDKTDGVSRETNVFCQWFNDGGEVPVYAGQFVKMLVVNPVLGQFEFTYGDDDNFPVFLTPMDRMRMACGFSWLIEQFVDDLSDNDLSIRLVQFLKRTPVLFVAKTSQELAAMQGVLQSMADGDTNIVSQSPLDGAIQRLDGQQSQVALLSEFTEYQQYKLGQFYNMLGVNSVWNMKREHVAAAENVTNGETARYNISDIVDNLNEQLEEVNKRFNTMFHVKLNVVKAAEIMQELEEPEDEPEDEPEELEEPDEPEEGEPDED